MLGRSIRNITEVKNGRHNNVDIRKIFNEAWLYIEDDQIKICIDADDGLLIDLQENQNLTRIIADALKKVYRYEGKFSIEGLSF